MFTFLYIHDYTNVNTHVYTYVYTHVYTFAHSCLHNFTLMLQRFTLSLMFALMFIHMCTQCLHTHFKIQMFMYIFVLDYKVFKL